MVSGVSHYRNGCTIEVLRFLQTNPPIVMKSEKSYEQPVLQHYGSLTDLTREGNEGCTDQNPGSPGPSDNPAYCS